MGEEYRDFNIMSDRTCGYHSASDGKYEKNNSKKGRYIHLAIICIENNVFLSRWTPIMKHEHRNVQNVRIALRKSNYLRCS